MLGFAISISGDSTAEGSTSIGTAVSMASIAEIVGPVGQDSRGALDSNRSRVSVRHAETAFGAVQHERDVEATEVSSDFGAYHREQE